jgi:serine protease Do
MMKRKEFMLGAVAGLAFAAAATAGGVIDWPTAEAGPVAGVSGRLAPSAGAAGLAFAPPQGAPLSFADIFAQVAPAVVQIDVKTRVASRQGFIQIPGLGAVPVPGAPGGAEGEEGADGEGGATALGAGSGFFIAANGFIVTNNHVVADATEIMVKLADGRELKATVVGADPATDLAVIKVEGRDFPFVSFEDRAQPRVGDWVIAVGNPFGLGGTATAGIVSALSRQNLDDDTAQYVDFLQIDAAINRGNSGGPTFDIYGRVIGVNSAIYSQTGGSVGIGFAIPANIAKTVTEQLMRGGKVERGYLGVSISTLSDEQREALGLPDTMNGAFVGEVTPGGPADRAGLQPEVLTIDGEPVTSSTELTRHVAATPAGTTLRLGVLREGRRLNIDVRAALRPPEDVVRGGRANQGQEEPAVPEGAVGQVVEGMTVVTLTPALRTRYSLPADQEGVVVTAVTPRSRAARLQVPPGLVILRANNRAVSTPAELKAAVDAARSAGRPGILLFVRLPAGLRSVVLNKPQLLGPPPFGITMLVSQKRFERRPDALLGCNAPLGLQSMVDSHSVRCSLEGA